MPVWVCGLVRMSMFQASTLRAGRSAGYRLVAVARGQRVVEEEHTLHRSCRDECLPFCPACYQPSPTISTADSAAATLYLRPKARRIWNPRLRADPLFRGRLSSYSRERGPHSMPRSCPRRCIRAPPVEALLTTRASRLSAHLPSRRRTWC
jgi:hypothetical protein